MSSDHSSTPGKTPNRHVNDGRIFCPVHHRPTPGGVCEYCDRAGIFAVVCEIDKISRTIDTLTQQDYEYDPRGNASFAVLLFRDKSSDERSQHPQH